MMPYLIFLQFKDQDQKDFC